MRDRLAGATALAALLLGASVSQAQQPYVVGGSGQPAVYVNTQVLNSLTPGFAPGSPYAPYNYGAYGYQQQVPSPYQQPYGQPAYGQQPATIGGYYITRPSTLLFPPQQFPQSQVTVSPQQLAGLQPSPAPAQPGSSLQLTPPAAAAAPPTTGATPPSEPSLSAPAAAPSASQPAAAESQAAAAPTAPSIEAPSAPTPENTAADLSASEGQVPAIPPPNLAADEPPPPPEPPAETQVAAAPAEPPAPEPPAAPAATEESAESAPPPPEPEAVAEDSSAALAPPPPDLPPEPAPPAQADAAAETQSGETQSGETQSGETQTAALTTGAAETPDGSKRLIFAEGTADLDEAAKQVLRGVAEGLKSDQNARVQLLAYASSDDDSASRARRMSLSRALAVRQFLIKEGVRSTRMDVRALGNKFEGGPADRVDILPARR